MGKSIGGGGKDMSACLRMGAVENGEQLLKCRVFFWDNENTLKLEVLMIIEPCKYTTGHWTEHLNNMVKTFVMWILSQNKNWKE